MGEIADLVIDGVFCELCGLYIGEAVGYPRKCSNCIRQSQKKRKRKKNKEKK